MGTRIRNLAIPIIVSVALIVAIILGLEIAGTPRSVPSRLPSLTPVSAMPSAVNAASIILAGNNMTQTLTGTGVILGSYTADCYESATLTGTQAITLAIQHSPDNYSWHSLYSFGVVTNAAASLATTTAFTHTDLYGSYIRGIATLSSTQPLTMSLLCVFR